MRILVVSQFFYPETFRSNDVAFELQRRGHEVTVLTGIPNYPEGKIYKGYGFLKNRKQNIDGVIIIRTLLIPRGKGKAVNMALNYLSWTLFASLKSFFLSNKLKFDAVFVHGSSPVIQFYPALIFKRKQNIPIYFWLLDLWPESLEYAGNIKNQYVMNSFNKVVKKFYRESEKILISSKGFKESILEKGDFADKIIYFPNWAEDVLANGNQNYAIPELPEGFKVMFAGNVGEAQDIEAIMEAALKLKNHGNIKFIIVGDGRKLFYIHDFIAKHQLEENVICVGRFPIEAMSTFFSKADVMLVSLKDSPIFNLTAPARIQAYMSASKAIIGMINGDGAKLIEEAKCGFTVPAGNGSALADLIIRMAEMPREEIIEIGKRGRMFFDAHFQMRNCIDHLEAILSKNNNTSY